MARRRSTEEADPVGAILALLALVAVAFAFEGLRWLYVHPLVSVPIGLTVATGAGVAVKLQANTRRRQLEWEYQQSQIRAAQEAEEERIRAARSMHIEQYHVMSPREFEEAIAYLCQRDGCTSVQVVGGRGDLGADVKAVAPDGRRIVIQCKRYGPTNKVGSGDMQKFGGTCYAVHQANVAALVTTSTFTKDAANYGTGMRIGLYDVDALAGWASRTGPAPWH